MSDRGVYRGIYAVLLDTGDFQSLPERARHLLITLKLTRLNNLASIYVLDEGGILTISKQTGIGVKAIHGLLKVLQDTHWIAIEYPLVWVVNGLRYEPSISLSNENHRKAVHNVLKNLPKLPIVHKFCDYYGLAYPFDTPSIPSRSIEIEIEMEKETEKEPEIEKNGAASGPEISESGPAGDFRRWVQAHKRLMFALFTKTRSNVTGKNHAGLDWINAEVPRMCGHIRAHVEEFAGKPEWPAFVVGWLMRNIRQYPTQMMATEEAEYDANKRRREWPSGPRPISEILTKVMPKAGANG